MEAMTLVMNDVHFVLAMLPLVATAAYGIVDATKAIGGGVSNAGFASIRRVLRKLLAFDECSRPELAPNHVALSGADIEATLKANWINGVPLADQKAMAKELITLSLDSLSCGRLSMTTGVDRSVLQAATANLRSGSTLSSQEQNVVTRFTTVIAALLDEGYGRADQRYRNWCKVCAASVALLICVLGGWVFHPDHYWSSSACAKAVLVGVFAMPFAPISKDIASALEAGSKAMQLLRKG